MFAYFLHELEFLLCSRLLNSIARHSPTSLFSSSNPLPPLRSAFLHAHMPFTLMHVVTVHNTPCRVSIPTSQSDGWPLFPSCPSALPPATSSLGAASSLASPHYWTPSSSLAALAIRAATTVMAPSSATVLPIPLLLVPRQPHVPHKAPRRPHVPHKAPRRPHVPHKAPGRRHGPPARWCTGALSPLLLTRSAHPLPIPERQWCHPQVDAAAAICGCCCSPLQLQSRSPPCQPLSSVQEIAWRK